MVEDNTNKISKILLMGKAGVGKTSIKSIIFSNISPRDTSELSITRGIEEIKVNFLKDLTLCICDCGGQEEYQKKYFESEENIEEIFSQTKSLIFVLDVKDNQYSLLEKCVVSVKKYSTNSKIFILLNKTDLIKDTTQIEELISLRKKEITELVNIEDSIYPTSIYDYSLYKVWNKIVSSLIISRSLLESNLKNLCISCNSDEVLVFEKNSLLLISLYETESDKSNSINRDDQLECLSYIIKKFKISCNEKLRMKFSSLVLKFKNGNILIDELTHSSYIMLYFCNGKKIDNGLINTNISIMKEGLKNIII